MKFRKLMRFGKLLQLPGMAFRWLFGALWYPVSAIFAFWGLPFRIKGKGRERMILAGIFAVSVLAAAFDYPAAWNKGADWLNPRLDGMFEFAGSRVHSSRISGLKDRIAVPRMERAFLLGLDLQGGTQLVYEADLSNVGESDADSTMRGLRDILERRVNNLGVKEPVVQLEQSGATQRIIVELAGVKDVQAAVKAVGETPTLEFREERPQLELDEILAGPTGEGISEEAKQTFLQTPSARFKSLDPPFGGQYLSRAYVSYDQVTSQPVVSIEFDGEGSKIFEDLTERNIGKTVAIFINSELISAPAVQSKISGGKAVISGSFTAEGAAFLARNLNAGALNAPIHLVFQETVGATLGEESLQKSLRAGLIGFAAVAVFMLLWYRLPGLVAVCALGMYTALVLAIFKLMAVTMTLPGIAGLILSVGMAVDANILIITRMREERRWGRPFASSVTEGFGRAWPSIRDSNVSTIITTLILFLIGTSFIKGFALTLGIGVVVSMFTAVFVSRLVMKLFIKKPLERFSWIW